MSYSSFISLRYLKTKRKISSISAISLISLLGVIIGTAALIIVISVFNGFQGIVTQILVNFDPHVRITASSGDRLPDASSILSHVEKLNDVESATPFLSGKAMIVSGNINRAVYIKGIVPASNQKVSSLSKSVVLGHFLRPGKTNEILIGISLADALGAIVGDTVAVISPAGLELSLTQFYQPRVQKFVVCGIYQSKNKDYDGYYAFVNLSSSQELFASPGTTVNSSMVNGIDIRLKTISEADHIKALLQKEYPAVRVETWYDLHRDLYRMMTIERIVAYTVLSLIILVAAFNILGSISMTVIEKRREIGALKAMGATNRGIVKIYLYEGLAIGLVGSVAGSLVGFLVGEAQIKFHLFKLDTTVYIIPALPVEMHLSDFFIVASIAILICSLAALYPAKRAAEINPADAVRWE
ncbi:MAG: FtsX-like permease family protein [Candidatus Kryptoniota bacterium]